MNRIDELTSFLNYEKTAEYSVIGGFLLLLFMVDGDRITNENSFITILLEISTF
jgi:hypothetical protein